MTRADMLVPVAQPDAADERTLPLVLTRDPQVEQLLRRWEAEKKAPMTTQPTPRPNPRREPYAHD